MHDAHARVPSEKAERYLAQLCKHFAHKIPASWEGTKGQADFGFGTCEMQAGNGELLLHCKAPTTSELDRVKYIVEDHVVRFGWKEELAVNWQDGAGAT